LPPHPPSGASPFGDIFGSLHVGAKIQADP